MTTEEKMFKEITALTHKYGLQEVYGVIAARYRSMNRQVAQFVEDVQNDAILHHDNDAVIE